MPIGIDSGGNGGGIGGGAAETPPPAGDGTDAGQVPDPELTAVIYEQWLTAEDERVCWECGPLDWGVWEQGFGPYPPLHINCRCVRVYAWTEYRTAEV
jgi:hypothetical protein